MYTPIVTIYPSPVLNMNTVMSSTTIIQSRQLAIPLLMQLMVIHPVR
jgi:hypothetical protein